MSIEELMPILMYMLVGLLGTLTLALFAMVIWILKDLTNDFNK